jgi:hypothetical protein
LFVVVGVVLVLGVETGFDVAVVVERLFDASPEPRRRVRLDTPDAVPCELRSTEEDEVEVAEVEGLLSEEKAEMRERGGFIDSAR